MKTSIDQNLNIAVPSATGAKFSLQRGLSLIELMISITLGLIILAALSTLFVNQTRTRVELDKSNRMIDNGRYAMDLLSSDLGLAGYLGELVPILSACSYAPVGIGGYDAGLTNIPASLPTGLTAADISVGSDIVTIRRASTATPTAQAAAVAGVEYLQVSLCQFDALTYKISTTPGDFTLRQKSCTPTSTTPYANLRRMVEHVYFVSPSNDETIVVPGSGCATGDCIPTLKRRETNQTTGVAENVPLVEGIEYMQIEYGVDSNNTFQIMATTTAGSLVLTDLTVNPFATNPPVSHGMGVYDATSPPKIPAGYTVDFATAPVVSPATLGKITLVQAAGANPIVASVGTSSVPLTIPYLTATITPVSNVLTNLSADPNMALVRQGYEICGAGIAAGSTIDSWTPTTITLSKNALQCSAVPAAACPSVPLTIPAIVISPKPLAGDGVADIYTAAPTATQWSNVVSVRLTLLARNTEPTRGYTDTKVYDLGGGQTVGPLNDNYKRHIYRQFIRLVNTAGRRE